MTRIIRLAAFGMCAVAALTVVNKAAEPERGNSKSSDHDPPMSCITPNRIAPSEQVKTACLPSRPFGPHSDAAEIQIYANKIALDYRREHPKSFDYPVGSKFVKEKFANKGDEHPDLATVMEKKTAKGKVSDWRFSTISLPDKTPLKSASKDSCVSCHREYKDRGYVSYESESALKRYLKINE
jgi:Cytochrome P460